MIERTASEIVRSLEAVGDSDVTTKVIGEYAMKALAKIDPVSYVRYASVYKDFREVDDYTDFLKKNYKKA